MKEYYCVNHFRTTSHMICDKKATNVFTCQYHVIPFPLCDKHYNETLEWCKCEHKEHPSLNKEENNADFKILQLLFEDAAKRLTYRSAVREPFQRYYQYTPLGFLYEKRLHK